MSSPIAKHGRVNSPAMEKAKRICEGVIREADDGKDRLGTYGGREREEKNLEEYGKNANHNHDQPKHHLEG